MFANLELPPGFYRTGTDLQAQGRWRDGSLVRWHNNAMQPVGGWRLRANFTDELYRGSISWEDNGGDRWLAAGSASYLKVSTYAGTVSDITPAGFTTGIADATTNTGFGGGAYGSGTYGTPTLGSTYSEATTWSLDTWGEYLLACSVADGKIYEWQLNTGTPAAAVSNAPTSNLGVLVTPERFVFALGASGDPRQIKWSDRENNTSWTPAATNEAGDIVLQSVGQIMCGINVTGETLIMTDYEAYAATYQGPPFVYGFRRVGSACGVLSRRAAAPIDSGAMWMGENSFYLYQGGNVQTLQCDVSDAVFADINLNQRSKCHAVTNAKYNEVWFFYCSNVSTEIDKYVAYNYVGGFWLMGDIGRTTGVDSGTFDLPVWFSADNSVCYDHEVGYDWDGNTVYAESGPVVLGSDSGLTSALEFHPDEQTQGDVTATFKVRNYPNDSETSFGPYTAATPTNVRFTGRQIRLRVTGSALDSWRWGAPRLRVEQRGQR